MTDDQMSSSLYFHNERHQNLLALNGLTVDKYNISLNQTTIDELNHRFFINAIELVNARFIFRNP